MSEKRGWKSERTEFFQCLVLSQVVREAVWAGSDEAAPHSRRGLKQVVE